MAQTPQSEETGAAGETTAPGTGRPQGLFGSSTTILLLVFAVAVFWWSRRRRVEMEERLRAQRREAEATAERSALDVAHLMRAAPQPGAAAAAAREGLASAARGPISRVPETAADVGGEPRTATEDEAPGSSQMPQIGDQDVADARALERAEAQAAAERAAEEQAERASREAKSGGESALRRMAAASAAAQEAKADTVDAERAGTTSDLAGASVQEQQAPGTTQGEVRRRGSTKSVPPGAVAGDGTASCPPDYPIKGNAQSRIYHRPGQISYQSTVAEFCFASEEAAEAAGFRQSRARGQRTQP